MKKNLLLGMVAVALLIVVGYDRIPKIAMPQILSGGKKVSIEEAKQITTEFVEKNLLQAGTKLDIKDIKEENGMYKMNLDVSGQKIEAYLSADGKVFFPQAMNIDDYVKKQADAKKAKEDAEASRPKTDRPTVDLYVMSFCPYGNKAEDTLKPVYELLKDKVDFNFRYIVSTEGEKIQSLHGQKEVDQNEREACVLKNYGKEQWLNFVTYVNAKCGSDGACWQEGAQQFKLNIGEINACAAKEGLALMTADEKASVAAGATGSPTMIINGTTTETVYQYGNSEAYKAAICASFNTVPEECSKTLTSAASTSEGGSCGN